MYDVLPHDIQEFIIHCSTHLTSGSVSNILCYLRKFHKHLYDTQKYPVDCQKLLSIRITRENKIRSYMPEEEIDLTLKQVDLTASLGKRDYAILLLGAFTGMRGVDVVNFQISAIDWYKHSISIVQQKTGEPPILPLIPKVEEAIRNYLLFGRPTLNFKYVFLRDNTPFEKFVSAVAIDYILKKYQNKAGLNRKAFDGKGYHSFRRFLARQMVLEGVPVTTVAQVLGHSNMNSSKQYIYPDSTNLKQYALDLKGIEVGRELANEEI